MNNNYILNTYLKLNTFYLNTINYVIVEINSICLNNITMTSVEINVLYIHTCKHRNDSL